MKKHCKRRIRSASEPAMVRMHCVPDVEIHERLAIQALRGGWATYNTYRTLADCHGALTIGRKRKGDYSLEGAIKASGIALLNIFDRMQATGKVGATGDELRALQLLVDTAEDFWRRQSSGALEYAIAALKEVRKRQIEEMKTA